MRNREIREFWKKNKIYDYFYAMIQSFMLKSAPIHNTVLTALSAAILFSCTGKTQPEYKEISADRIAQLAEEHSIPSLQMTFYQQGQEYQTIVSGTDSADGTDQAIYQAASLSKVIFSYIVMRLADEGIIGLDVPVCSYTGIDRFVDKKMAARLTPRMILSHTSGLYNWAYSPVADEWATSPIAFHYPVDSRFAYSGEAFSFLQRAVEDVTGESLNQLAERYVFEPFDMPLSSYEWRTEYETLALDGFTSDGRNTGKDEDFGSNCAYTLRTNSTEFMNFIVHAILYGEGLSDSAYSAWLTPRSHAIRFANERRECDKNMYWCLGVGSVCREDTTQPDKYWHWGDNGTMKCLFVVDHDKGIAFDYFTNSANGHDISDELCEMVFGEAFSIEDWIDNRDDE